MALVDNAADRKQVQRATSKQKTRREQELSDLRVLLATTCGRRFVWSLLSKCGLYESGWDPSAKIHFNAGRRQVGLELMADIASADEHAFLVMMTEAQQQEKRDRQEQHALNKTKEGFNDARSEYHSGAEPTESGE